MHELEVRQMMSGRDEAYILCFPANLGNLIWLLRHLWPFPQLTNLFLLNNHHHHHNCLIRLLKLSYLINFVQLLLN